MRSKLGYFRQGMFWKNLTLGAVKVFLTVLEILLLNFKSLKTLSLEIKSFRYHLKFSILGGFSAGPKGTLDPMATKNLNSFNAEINGINR